MYVSITGLKVRGLLQAPLFWWHAVRSFNQARKAPGNISAAVRKIDGVQHTLTVWEDRAAMRRFLVTGAHLGAMRDFRRVGSGKTCGYESDTPPDWETALAYWRAHAREY
jgi:hypothetical protein